MRINIYHTNDIHSNFEFLRKVNGYIRNNKNNDDIYLDSGDFTDLRSLVVQADGGKSALSLLLSTGLDAMAVGNNEIDLGYDNLSALAAMDLPILSANLTDDQGREIGGLKKSMVIERANKRFLIIGVSPYYNERFKLGAYNNFFILGNIMTHDPIGEINREIEKNRGNYDYCILLSHSGLIVDRKIASQCPGVDLFLGGHSHSKVAEENYSQSGRGELLGRITLDISDKIEIVENVQIDLENINNPDFDKLYEEKIRFADSILSEELDVCGELDFNPFRECPLINFVCDALYHEYDVDFAVMHNGIAEYSLKRPVSKKSLLEEFPSKLNSTIYHIKGDRILESIRLSFDSEHIEQSGKAAGFRGTVLGSLSFSKNVRVVEDPLYVTINGEELDTEKIYKIATDDYLQRGSYYRSMAAPDDDSVYDNMFIRDLVEKHLMSCELFQSSNNTRIIYNK